MLYWNLISNHYIRFNFQQGVLGASSSVSSLVDFSVSSSVSSLVSSSSLGSSSSGYRYSFTVVVLKSVGLLGSCTLYISLTILSNLNGLVYLLLYLGLPFCYTNIFKLRGRL